MSRYQFNTLAFGINGTGKTQEALEVMELAVQENPEKRGLCIISNSAEPKFHKYPLLKIHTDYHRLAKRDELKIDDIDMRDIQTFTNFRGIAKILCEDALLYDFLRVILTEPIFPDDENSFIGLNGTILNDDCRDYLDQRPNSVLRFMRRRRQLNADMISTFHGFHSEMPPSFVNWATHLWIFRVNTPIDSLLKILDPDKHEALIEGVNKMKHATSILTPEGKMKYPYYYSEVELQPVIL